MGAQQAVRVLRCAIFATATTVLAALAHLASGMATPPPGWLLAAGAAVGVAVHPLTRRERGLPTLVGAAVAGQLVLHAVLTVAMVGSTCRLSNGAAAMPGMGPAPITSATANGMGCAAGGWLPMSTTGRSAGVMCAGHLLAAVMLAWWLRRGERALVRLGVVVRQALAPVVRRLVAVLLPVRPPLTPAVAHAAGWGVIRVPNPGLRGAQVRARRGPPGVVAA